jgi:hypothetical protein
MANLPTDIANQALDAIAADFVLGDIEEGTKQADLLLRAYRQNLMQLLRAAHWDFARKTVPLVLLADSTGNTPNVGTLVPPGQFVYEYEYPIDCMKARWVPRHHIHNPGAPAGNIVPPNSASPLMPGLNQQTPGLRRNHPARFTVATDFNYPPPQGQITWETQGVSPQGRTVILTNVRHAHLVYTALMLYPSVWDPQFRAAMVALLASEVALPIWLQKDRKFGMQLRTQQIAIAREKIMQARITDGNEGWFSSDIPVDWLASRNTGGGWGGCWGHGAWGDDGGGGGGWGYGWDSFGFADGSAY